MASVAHMGSTFDSFLQEENIYDEAMKALSEKLNAYAIARDREHSAIALAKTYNRRRQIAYSAYLKALDASKGQLDDDDHRILSERLEVINQFKGK